jgi:hypothetical protein
MELADADGITVALTCVELWPRGVIVDLEGVRSPLREELDAEYTAIVGRWTEHLKVARAAGAEPEWWPSPPGELLMRLPLTICDDADTVYRPLSKQAGGTGTEWLSRWVFAPRPPIEPTLLIVTVEGADCARHTVDVALRAPSRGPGPTP